MDSVFIVTAGSHSDYRIEGVFSTYELAKEFAGRMSCCDPENDITEFLIDYRSKELPSVTYRSVIALHQQAEIERLNVEIISVPLGQLQTGFSARFSDNTRCFYSESHVSQDHADKLAIDARIAYMNQHGIKEYNPYELTSEQIEQAREKMKHLAIKNANKEEI